MTREPAQRRIAVAAMLLGVVVLAWAGLTARAADTAKIEGALKGADGVVLAQANVTLKPPSGAEKKTVTDAKGAFTFTGLAAGTYSVTLDSPGFQTTRYTHLALTEGQNRQFDFTLRPGAVSSAVEVDITHPVAPPEAGRVYAPVPGLADPLRLPAPGTLPQGNGVISGRILNYTGAPASTARVGAIAAESSLYGIPRVMTFDARTDNLGFYRLELPPGRYFVVTGAEVFTQDGSYLERPVFFPGVADSSRALAIAVGPGTSDTADFRLDGPPVYVPVVPVPAPLPYYYGPFRVGGQVIFTQILVPVPYPQYPPYSPYPPYSTIYPYPGSPLYSLQVILQSGGNAARGCGPARTSYSAGVARDGQFEFRSVSPGIYDVCVVQAGGGRGSGASAGGGRAVLYGPAAIVVDRDVAGLRLDIGGAWIVQGY